MSANEGSSVHPEWSCPGERLHFFVDIRKKLYYCNNTIMKKRGENDQINFE